MTVPKNPFEMLINEILSNENNYVMFTMISPEIDYGEGTFTQVGHMAFDMDYCENEI
jgi:hypothetical protein